jgi:tetratricopeptide (TPR) repeat protein
MLNDLLNEYIFDCENPILNYKLGLEYEKLGQTASAVSYFLRVVERTDDDLMAYECLLRLGQCFEKQRNRNYTVRSMFQAAITLMPDRPEAYYLISKRYEEDSSHFESYEMCEIALRLSKKDSELKPINVGYPGRWIFSFQKAVSGWWRGRAQESRDLIIHLIENHVHDLSESQKEIIRNNVFKLDTKYIEMLQTPKSNGKKIVDYCTFFEPTGKEMLKLRVAILNDYVDEFIVVESNKTQSGLPIKFELEKVIDKLNLPKEKIRIVKLEIPEAEDLVIEEIDRLNCYENNSSNIESLRARVRDRLQKNALLSVIDEYDDDAVFIISDIDEILDPKYIPLASSLARQYLDRVIRIPIVHLEGRADLRVHMRDTDLPKEWTGMIVTTKIQLKQTTPNQIRSGIFNTLPIDFIADNGKRIDDMGWHFSWMGGKAITKLKSKIFTHHADSFSYLVSSKYSDDDMENFLDSIELKEGKISPSGDKNTILKSYPIENLPKEIFEIPEVEEFLFPKLNKEVVMTHGTKQDSKEIVIKAYEKYDKQLCWGWCTLDKAGCFVDYIDDICTRVENPVCVEVGVFGGKSVLPVALELKRHKKGILHAIDPWTNEEAGKGYENLGSEYEYWKNVNLQGMYEFFINLLKEYDVEEYVNVIKTTSDDAPIIEDIDFLYIDGQHTEQAHRDVMKFATRVKLGGYCVADDVAWGEVKEVPNMLEALGFMHIHYLDTAYVYKRTNIVDFTKEETNIFSINTNQAKRAFIVDNFYKDPMAIRKFAQTQEYVQGGIGRGFIGRRSVQQFLFPGIKEAFESIMGKKITAWKEHGMNGRFQLNIGGEQLVYHCDSQKYAAMIYLTPNAPPSCGTSTFMHKKSGVHHNSDPRINEVFAGIKTTMDRTPYENVDKFGNIFNRLVIFDGGCIHAASDYFGADMEDGRLWHMFFFDAE